MTFIIICLLCRWFILYTYKMKEIDTAVIEESSRKIEKKWWTQIKEETKKIQEALLNMIARNNYYANKKKIIEYISERLRRIDYRYWPLALDSAKYKVENFMNQNLSKQNISLDNLKNLKKRVDDYVTLQEKIWANRWRIKTKIMEGIDKAQRETLLENKLGSEQLKERNKVEREKQDANEKRKQEESYIRSIAHYEVEMGNPWMNTANILIKNNKIATLWRNLSIFRKLDSSVAIKIIRICDDWMRCFIENIHCFEKLNSEVAWACIQEGKEGVFMKNISIFTDLNSTIANWLLTNGQEKFFCKNLTHFSHLSTFIAQMMKEKWYSEYIPGNRHSFENPKEAATYWSPLLAKPQETSHIEEENKAPIQKLYDIESASFGDILRKKGWDKRQETKLTPDICLDETQKFNLLHNTLLIKIHEWLWQEVIDHMLDKKWVDHNIIAKNILLEDKELFKKNILRFKNLRAETVRTIIKDWGEAIIEKYTRIFDKEELPLIKDLIQQYKDKKSTIKKNQLPKRVAQRRIDNHEYWELSFEGLTPIQSWVVLEKLIFRKEFELIKEHLPTLTHIDIWVAKKLIQAKRRSIVVDNIESFEKFDKEISLALFETDVDMDLGKTIEYARVMDECADHFIDIEDSEIQRKLQENGYN